jgi:DNA-binding FadR family transcriptional regulator
VEYLHPGKHGQLVEAIGKNIVQGAFAGALDVPALESRYGVSRTVVREALRVLGAKGLVDARPKRGTQVSPRASWNMLDADVLRWELATRQGPSTLEDLADVRGVLEPFAARLAARSANPQDIAELQSALDLMRSSSGDAHAAAAADVSFHRALARAAHNVFLEPMEEILLVGLHSRDVAVEAAVASHSVDLHEALLEAIRSGDPDRAEAAMFQILDRSRADNRSLE